MKGGRYSRLGLILLCSLLIPGTALAENQKKIRVEAIEVKGSTVFKAEDFAPALAGYTHREITFEELQKAAEQVSALYHRRGYLLVKAYIPQQSFTGDTARIEIVEGRLGEIIVQGSHQYYSDSFIKSHFDPLKDGQIYEQEKLERAILTLNDYQKLKVSATLQPGSAPGTSDLLVTANNSLPLNFSIDYNNFGNPYVGRNRLGATLQVGNLGLEGSSFVFRGITSDQPSDLLFGRLDYSLPVNAMGTRLGFTTEQGQYDVARDLSVLDLKGDVESYGTYLSHAFIRSKQTSLTGRVGFDLKNSKQELMGEKHSEDKIRTLSAGMDYENFDASGRTFAGVSLSQGLGEFLGGMDNNEYYTSRTGADGSFTKLTANAMRAERFSDTIFGLVRGSGQVAADSLVASELFLIGGGTSVRGYDMGEYSGDHGFNATAEIRYSPLADKELLQLAAFADYGWVRVKTPAVGQAKSHDLTGVGVGARLNLPYEISISADVGFPISSSESADGDETHFYVSAAKKF